MSILEDNQGYLWLSTRNGLNKFDPATETFVHSDEPDGLQGNEYNEGAFFKDGDGKLYFGKPKGFTVFHPDSLRENTYIPPVMLTDFLLFNQSVPVCDTTVLQKHISYTKTIELDYTDYIFTFEFSALNYRQPQKNRYKYKLENYDHNWIETDYQHRRATYTRIPHGNYTFRVIASNDDGYWNNEGASVQIIIHPPWWLTWWMKTIYLILGLGLPLSFYYIRVNALKKHHELLEQQVEERTKEISQQKEEIFVQAEQLKVQNTKLIELDQFKQGMIGMIVHDLKNPLNAILSLAKDKSLSQMGKQMLNMVLNILDVQKFEDSKMTLDRNEFSICKITNQAMQEVSFLSQRRNISIINTIPDFAVKIDVEIIKRIFVNLFSNAIKYSKPNEKIEITGFKDQPGFIRIEISDSGEGIPQDKLEQVFVKFGQVKAKSSGRIRSTGLGLTFCKLAIEAHGGTIGVNSDIGKGTVFWFTLPESRPGEKPVVSESSTVIENQRYSLTDRDKKILIHIIKKLRNYEVYEISSLQKILKQINSSYSDGLRIWKEELHNAIYSGNKDKYNALLKNQE